MSMCGKVCVGEKTSAGANGDGSVMEYIVRWLLTGLIKSVHSWSRR